MRVSFKCPLPVQDKNNFVTEKSDGTRAKGKSKLFKKYKKQNTSIKANFMKQVWKRLVPQHGKRVNEVNEIMAEHQTSLHLGPAFSFKLRDLMSEK